MIHLLHFEGEEARLDALLLPWLDRLGSWHSADFFQRKFFQRSAHSCPAAAGRRRQSACAWALLELALRRERGLELAALELGETSYQKPVCISNPGLYFSLSHCEGMAACAVADFPVGVDCEALRPFPRGVAQRVCPPAELGEILASSDPGETFCQHWTLKESFVKAVGTGLSFSLRRVAFFLGDGAVRLELERPVRPEEEALLGLFPRPAFVLHRCPPAYWLAGCILYGETERTCIRPQLPDQVVPWSLKDLAEGLEAPFPAVL